MLRDFSHASQGYMDIQSAVRAYATARITLSADRPSSMQGGGGTP